MHATRVVWYARGVPISPLQYYPPTPSLVPREPPRVRGKDWLRILIPMMGGLIPLGAFMLENKGYDAEARMLFVTWGLVGATTAGIAVFQQIENEQREQQAGADGLGGLRLGATADQRHPLTGAHWPE